MRLAAILLAMAGPLAASECAQAKAQESKRHQGVGAEIAKQRVDAQAVYANERRACRSSDKACLDAAAQRHRDVLTKIRALELDEEATHLKMDIETGVNCAPPRPRVNVACPESYAAEEMRHRRTSAEVAKRRVDANNALSQARNRCQPRDNPCLQATQLPHTAEMRRIAMEEQNERARHQKAEIDLRRCGGC
jgi:hypothetical protein